MNAYAVYTDSAGEAIGELVARHVVSVERRGDEVRLLRDVPIPHLPVHSRFLPSLPLLIPRFVPAVVHRLTCAADVQVVIGDRLPDSVRVRRACDPAPELRHLSPSRPDIEAKPR